MFDTQEAKFKRWREADLVSQDQVEAIKTFERNRRQGNLVSNFTRVGVIAILIGIASLVASNWFYFSANGKLIGHFLLNAFVAAAMVKADADRNPSLKDACVLGLFGLFLTFIALVGQIYQLHGELHKTLLFWLAICTPFVWAFGRTHLAAIPWTSATVIIAYLNFVFYMDKDYESLKTAVIFSLYLPPILLLLTRSSWLQTHRAGFINAFRELGHAMPAFVATIAILLFYMKERHLGGHETFLDILAAGLVAIYFLFRPTISGKTTAQSVWYYLLVSGAITLLPFLLPQLDNDVMPAVLFIGYWMFMAWLGSRISNDRLMNIAISLVIIRLFIIYLEVFGSLLQTGIGLIISGIVLLVVLRFFNRFIALGRRLVNHDPA